MNRDHNKTGIITKSVTVLMKHVYEKRKIPDMNSSDKNSR